MSQARRPARVHASGVFRSIDIERVFDRGIDPDRVRPKDEDSRRVSSFATSSRLGMLQLGIVAHADHNFI